MVEVSVSHLAPLATAVADADAEWLAALGGAPSSAVSDDDVEAMSDASLLQVNRMLASAERRLQALQVRLANEISKRSAPELGKDGLARKAGFKTPATLIATTAGGHPAEAKKLIKVGDATAGRMTFSGERAPARHPHVAAAVDAGSLSVACAGAITALLDKLACRVDRAVLEEAEQTLVDQSAELSLTELQVVLRRAEAWLDPDGLQPKIESLRSQRYLKVWEDQHGMINLDGKLDPETGAPVKAAIDALVTAQIRAMRGDNHPTQQSGAANSDGGGVGGGGHGDAAAGVHAGDGEWAWSAGAAPTADAGAASLVERRTLQQLQADALAALAKHSLRCDATDLPLAATTVVVRIPLDALTSGTGVATIDGIAQPVDAGTARRMAADAEIIPLVLGEKSQVLDVGRSRRLFTKAQRLALGERDGGCAGCGAPPGLTEAHHLTWWANGGTTDLSNGILLCTSCHHSIHNDDWNIRIDGPDVWFVPPAHIDPARTPRRGGRRRFDFRCAA